MACSDAREHLVIRFSESLSILTDSEIVRDEACKIFSDFLMMVDDAVGPIYSEGNELCDVHDRPYRIICYRVGAEMSDLTRSYLKLHLLLIFKSVAVACRRGEGENYLQDRFFRDLQEFVQVHRYAVEAVSIDNDDFGRVDEKFSSLERAVWDCRDKLSSEKCFSTMFKNRDAAVEKADVLCKEMQEKLGCDNPAKRKMIDNIFSAILPLRIWHMRREIIQATIEMLSCFFIEFRDRLDSGTISSLTEVIKRLEFPTQEKWNFRLLVQLFTLKADMIEYSKAAKDDEVIAMKVVNKIQVMISILKECTEKVGTGDFDLLHSTKSSAEPNQFDRPKRTWSTLVVYTERIYDCTLARFIDSKLKALDDLDPSGGDQDEGERLQKSMAREAV